MLASTLRPATSKPPSKRQLGPGANGKSITGLYTVLVEGDDINDPIGDAVRGIVDGHLVLTRKLASHNHYPALDVLESLSRLMPRVTTEAHRSSAGRCRDLLATWAENEELVRLGAYRKGSSAQVDEAIDRMPQLLKFLQQNGEGTAFEETLRQLDAAIGVKPTRSQLRPAVAR